MIKNGKLLYHLTALENLASILQQGLLSRSELDNEEFNDVADGKILHSRQSHQLDKYVPFHFFARTPFDYSVQHNHPDKDFVLIAVQREVAKANAWKIVPTHPLAEEGYQILDYDAGMAAINWDLIEQRDYDDRACKVACMAECLSPLCVKHNIFCSIYVKNDHSKALVDNMMKEYNLRNSDSQINDCHININPAMFVGE